MRRIPLKSSHCNRGILDHWPHARLTASRIYPRPFPVHERLVAKLCPMRSTLTAVQLASLTWDSIKEICNA